MALFTDPSQRQARLAALGLDEENVLECVQRGENARNNATPNHPPAYGGYSSYSETTRFLRDVYIPRGGGKDNTKNYCMLICPGGEDAVVVTSGDDATGDPNRTPQPRYKRGETAQEAVESAQRELWPTPTEQPGGGPQRIWFLLIKRRGAEVDCELSHVAGIDSGRVVRWEDRILFPATRVDPAPSMANRPDFTPPVELDIGTGE